MVNVRKRRGGTSPAMVYAARELRRDATPAERILWQALRGRRLNGLRFRRQHPVGRFVLDLFCVAHQLAIEVDGGIHQSPAQAAYDAERTACLAAQGIRVLRFTNTEVESQLEDVLQKIISATSSPSPDAVRPPGEGAGG